MRQQEQGDVTAPRTPPHPRKLLLLEDDPTLRRAFTGRLRSDGHRVDGVTTLRAARAALVESSYDCLVLDRMVPDGDGLELVAELQDQPDRAPMLVMSALGGDDQRVDGLWAGADDYVAKPVCLDELALRVSNVTKLTGPDESPRSGAVVRVGTVVLDRCRQQVRAGGAQVRLTRRQYAILEYLLVRADQVVLVEDLLEHCWDGRRPLLVNPLASHITRLRSIFRDRLELQAVRGAGYLLRAVSSEAA